MKAQCPACGRTTRVGVDEVDFLVRCDRCRTMLLARAASEGAMAEIGVAKAEVLPLGRIPERFSVPERGHIAELLTRRGVGRSGAFSLAEHAARIAERAGAHNRRAKVHVSRGYGSVGIVVFVAAAVVAVGLLIVGARYWAFRPAQAEGNVAISPVEAPSPHAAANAFTPRAKPAAARRTARGAPVVEAPQPTGTGELFPEVPARN